MTTLQDKLDNIYQTKLEIKSAIGTDSDVFSEYPAMIRSMAGGGVSYSYLDERLSYYVELTDLESMSYATESYVTNAIENIPSIDLSSYVTYSYLDSKEYITINDVPVIDTSSYVTYTYLGVRLSYYVDLTDLESMGYATESYVMDAIGNIPIIDTSSYVTYTYLESKEYITINDVPTVDTSSYVTYSYLDSCGYITSNDLPVINENIIPKENNTYTLGDASYLYSNSYIADMWTGTKNKFSNRSNNQVNLMLNNSWKYTFHSNGFSPANNNIQRLGSSDSQWVATYTGSLYLNGSDVNTVFPSYSYVNNIVGDIESALAALR